MSITLLNSFIISRVFLVYSLRFVMYKVMLSAKRDFKALFTFFFFKENWLLYIKLKFQFLLDKP